VYTLCVCVCVCVYTHTHTHTNGSRNSAVGIATAYELYDRRVGVRVPVESRIITSLSRPDQLWGLPGPGVISRDMKLTTNIQLVQENVDLYIHSAIRLHGVVRN
jgi:hypothetical protein